MYSIVRMYRDPSAPLRWLSDSDPSRRTIKRGLTLDEAQAHCRDPETSSSSCKSAASLKHTAECGYDAWMDGYEEDKPRGNRI
jgi:hypothetical protein